ncbi:hypothetical protein C0J52_25636 [Blattella germanica]|nr:hypothetical protein C0J52_25636 [Blattella germanica]
MSILKKFGVSLLSANPNWIRNILGFQGSTSNVPLWTNARFHSKLETQKTIQITSDIKDDLKLSKDIIDSVNTQLQEGKEGRLFAVVHVGGKQFKVTSEDLIVIEGYWPPQIGDQIKLEKVLLAGGTDFTLIGRPILSPELVSVHATVVEKTLSHIKTLFKKKRRKQYMRTKFYRIPHTMLRINGINIKPELDVKKEVEGVDGRIF